jgi:hypothetical protein
VIGTAPGITIESNRSRLVKNHLDLFNLSGLNLAQIEPQTGNDHAMSHIRDAEPQTDPFPLFDLDHIGLESTRFRGSGHNVNGADFGQGRSQTILKTKDSQWQSNQD